MKRALPAVLLILVAACTPITDPAADTGTPSGSTTTAEGVAAASSSSAESAADPSAEESTAEKSTAAGSTAAESTAPGLSTRTTSPTGGASNSDALSIEVRQGRTDIAAGVMVIRVVNDRDTPIQVVSATYTDARFADPAAWTGDSTIPARNARDLRVPIPSAACTDQAPAPAAVLQLAGQDAVAVPVVDPFDFVATTTAADCLARELGAAVTLDVAEVRFTGDGATEQAVIDLRATPTGAAPVRLDHVDGTILLKPVGEGTAWALDTDVTAPTTVELVAEPNRCDPHAVADDKVGTRFRVTVTLDSGLSGQLVVPASDEQRTALYAYLARRCS